MTVINDIKEYYANLLILQYRNKPKARETIKTGIDIYLGDGVVLQLENLLDIDTAEGEQLNIIGKILGCPRNVPGINNQRKYFSFHVDANSLGFSTVGNPSNGIAKNRSNSILANYTLEDDEYRQLLKFKAFINVWRGDMGSMDRALYEVFGDNVNLLSGTSEVTYEIQELTVALEAAQVLGYLKAPIGIKVNFDIAS